jgi:hypothetical protein
MTVLRNCRSFREWSDSSRALVQIGPFQTHHATFLNLKILGFEGCISRQDE